MDFQETIKINELIGKLGTDMVLNHKIRIDTFHLPYIEFEESFEMPGIFLHGPDFQQAVDCLEILQTRIPRFIHKTHLLPESRPGKDSQQLHFVREFEVAGSKYIYIFRLFTVYMGGAQASEIIKPATQDISPTFITNRLYFQARVVPVNSILHRDGWIIDFESTQIKDTLFQVSSSDMKRDMWSTVLFDEVDFSELDQRFSRFFSFDSDWPLGKIFSPFVVDYLSLCANLLYPDFEIVEMLVPHFHEGFTAFLKNRDLIAVRESTEFFWIAYCAAFAKELALAKSGNPHWVITSYPDQDWLEQL